LPQLSILIVIGVALFLLYLGASEEAQASSEPSIIEQKITALSNAIAFAEGYWDKEGNILMQNIPAQYHNPGDLGPGDAPDFPWKLHSGSQVVIFPDDTTGFLYLRKKIRRILTGQSTVYSLDDTFGAVASKYAGDLENWLHNVIFFLGVSSTITLREWIQK
jgi:hypothetical protein